MADAAICTNIIDSLCVSASVLLIARKHCCLQVSLTLRICVHCRMPSYIIAPPIPVMPTITFVNLTMISLYHLQACASAS